MSVLRFIRTLIIPYTRRRFFVITIFYKEIVHPHVLVRIPCYDLTPVSVFTVGLRIARRTSGTHTSHGLTGGEYKTREQIHRDIADSRLLAIPTSWSRVADSNLDWDRLYEIGSPSRVGDSLYRPLYHVCSPRHKGHADLTSSTPSSRLTRAVSLDIITNDVGCAR
jgi:hypothetical protein